MITKQLIITEAIQIANSLRQQNKIIVFTNGCFDILHAGHVRYLRDAKACGDYLIVGLNSDVSIKKIKGDKRPIISQNHRLEVLAGLESVNAIIMFDESDPFELIKSIRPDVLVKGADWPEHQIIGAEFVKSYGGKVERIPLIPDISTTEIIERIIQRYR